MTNKVTKVIQFGEGADHQLTLEYGEIARQADAAVLASMGDTVVLTTVCAQKNAVEARDFFPLTVNYKEPTYAAGKIPGGFMKREGRPSETETLVSRLIDRPLRPLFPEGFTNEVQVVSTVLSYDPDISPDILALIGASAALAISGLPFQGPIGAARVGYRDGMYLLNPSHEALKTSELDLVVAGTDDAILMVESEAHELSESVMLGAVLYGHEMMKGVINVIKEMAAEVGKPAWDWQAPAVNTEVKEAVAQAAKAKIAEAYGIKDKQQRVQTLKDIRAEVVAQLIPEGAEQPLEADVLKHFSKLEKSIVREKILKGEPRIDGRSSQTVRPISIRTGVLPRAHGSALFTRGETQALVTCTLGSERDAQMIDGLIGESKQNFMLHYNFPPYSVGEVGFMMGPKRREIGHGKLAKRAIEPLLPDNKECPYVMRVVSDITESNGSSSMATVCGTSLALMDAGIPFKKPVAGIAMGLVKEDERFAVLTDILGDEDHLGDMDFKVAGTETGVTALQMDIKITGITKDIMEQALEQANHARLHILGEMNKHITAPRASISEFAPRILTMKVPQDKIRDVIGKGGATIRSIIDETGVDIDINDDGVVSIYSPDENSQADAKNRIELLTKEIQAGEIYEGKVSKIVDFGAFVNLIPGKDGLLHISQISHERVQNVTDELKEGQMIKVKVLDVDRQGKIKLSMKELTPPPSEKKESASSEDVAQDSNS